MTSLILVLAFLAAVAAVALWLVGVHNQLVTLHKRAWDAWREIHASDLRAIGEIFSKGSGAAPPICAEFEVASYRSAAMLGDTASTVAAAKARARVYEMASPGATPPWRIEAEAASRSYGGFAAAYNARLRSPAGRAVALFARLRALPEL